MSDDLHEDLSAAFAASSGNAEVAADTGHNSAVDAGATGGAGPGDSGADQPDGDAAVSVDGDGAAARARDASGRFAPKGKEAPAAPKVAAPPPASAKAPAAPLKPGQVAVPVAKPATAGEPIAVAPVVPTEAVKPPEALKAPTSWKPSAREKWASLPPEVQQEAVRVDREVRVAMKEAAHVRQVAEEYQRVVGPFEQMIRAAGSTTHRAVESGLRAMHALHTAPPVGKAQMVARIIKDYGVDVKALDEILSGEAPAPAQQAEQRDQFRDPRFDQLLQGLEQRKSQAQQAEFQRVQAEIETFVASPEAEFFEDVREDVADILETAQRRKLNITLKEAYDRACWANPEVRAIVQQRQAAKSAVNAQASTQQARNAASSVKSQPAGPPTAAEPDDLDGALKKAFAQAGRR